MADPFNLDPSNLPDISHLHEGEQNRIRKGQYDAREMGLLLRGQNPWTRSGKPEPLKSVEPPEATLDQLLAIMHDTDRQFIESKDAPWSQREAIIDFHRRQWKEMHKPEAYSIPPEPEPPDSLTGEPSLSQVERVRQALNISEADARQFLESARGQKQTETPQQPSTGGIRVPGGTRSPTEKERRDAELRSFMPKQLRTAYEQADPEQRNMLWAANERAFEAAKKRQEQRMQNEQELTAKILDMLQRIKEDPSKARFLPPVDASLAELHKWYEEMSKPVRTIPFPGEGGQPSNAEPFEPDAPKSQRKAVQPFPRRGPVVAYVPEDERLGRRISEALSENVAEAERLMQMSKVPMHAKSESPTQQPVVRETPLASDSELAPRETTNFWLFGFLQDNKVLSALIAVVVFVLWTLPQWIATVWPVLIRDKTIPEWLTEKRWPGMTAGIYGWLTVAFFLTLVVLFLIIALSSKRDAHRIARKLSTTPEQLNDRRQLIKDWRRMISDVSRKYRSTKNRGDSFAEILERQPQYISLHPYLSDEVNTALRNEKFDDSVRIVVSDNQQKSFVNQDDEIKSILARDIARIAREWGLI